MSLRGVRVKVSRRGGGSGGRWSGWVLGAFLALVSGILLAAIASAPASAQQFSSEPSHAIVVRTTENVTQGGWVRLLESAKAAGVSRIDILLKQDEDFFESDKTGRELQSGELLIPLPGETTAKGWENADWLVQMLDRAKVLGIEIWAWWPVFHDAQTAAQFPAAKYLGGDGSVFVDAAVRGVRDRQEQLIKKLLRTYEFDGISLDWLRYDNWSDGNTGPLADEYRERAGVPLSPQCMGDPLRRAIWGDLRESSIADWVAQLIASSRPIQPRLKWGAYLLPPQFKEVSQNYGSLTEAGLEYIQPMIYWGIWGEQAEWAGEVVGRRLFWRQPDTQLVPTLDLNRPESELVASYEAMGEGGPGGISGFLWYLDGVWTDWHFKKIQRIQNRLREARRNAPKGPLPASAETLVAQPDTNRLAPAEFPRDSSAWTLALLAELYDQGALDNGYPVIPVLTFHRFVEGSQVPGKSIWANSSAYLDRLFNFIAEREFNVIPLSRLQAYMMSGSPGDLPSRPLVLTVDDGAHSVLKYFHPKAREHELPYALSVITSPLPGNSAHLDDETKSDRQLTWNEVQQIAESGLVELTSHTHELHAYVEQSPSAGPRAPSTVARVWLDGPGRRETDIEHYRRILNDLSSSRRELTARSANPVTTLAWPYGAFDEESEQAARVAGFTHFLLFGRLRFAKPSWTTHRISRVPITRDDEDIPLVLPDDPLTAQSWWLAFLDLARWTASAQLIEAALIQLDDERARHPEAELSRAALDFLRNRPGAASRRIQGLRAAYPGDVAVDRSITEFLKNYKRAL